jgi:hypothetical protein
MRLSYLSIGPPHFQQIPLPHELVLRVFPHLAHLCLSQQMGFPSSGKNTTTANPVT